jgi:apolipoprotein D and lipocalin family protein
MKHPIPAVFVAAFLVLTSFGMSMAQEKQKSPLPVVPDVNLERYAGTWYEIARLPNRFQNQCVGDVTATYELRSDGKITVTNRCRLEDGTFDQAQGIARPAAENGPDGKLKVRFAPALLSFLPWVWGDYWIMELAADYSYVVIGEPSRKYFWILARTPTLNEEVVNGIITRATANGYDLSQLIYTKQN